VKKCFPILHAEHFDWTSLAFSANSADYELACAKYAAVVTFDSLLLRQAGQVCPHRLVALTTARAREFSICWSRVI